MKKNQELFRDLIKDMQLSQTESESIKGGAMERCWGSCENCITTECLTCIFCVTTAFDKDGVSYYHADDFQQK